MAILLEFNSRCRRLLPLETIEPNNFCSFPLPTQMQYQNIGPLEANSRQLFAVNNRESLMIKWIESFSFILCFKWQCFMSISWPNLKMKSPLTTTTTTTTAQANKQRYLAHFLTLRAQTIIFWLHLFQKRANFHKSNNRERHKSAPTKRDADSGHCFVAASVSACPCVLSIQTSLGSRLDFTWYKEELMAL